MAAGAGNAGTRSMEGKQAIPHKRTARKCPSKAYQGISSITWQQSEPGVRMRFYFDSTSSAERPARIPIHDHIYIALPNAGQGTSSPPHPPKSSYFASSPPNSCPSSPAQGGYAVTLATRDARLLAASLGTPEVASHQDAGQGIARPTETSQRRQF